ncbi:glycosyltransferase family 4 protein [Sporolactobacillus nakayamae]|uniref:Glycosyltransferase involved in cell wall bisynthesis n=1 Tax=Sporolactobacillus nakayamae TaxID=269670 RepID=A0A1I2T2L0_9BACL|nr:glycosyltransferase family 4 protein [Sporolactobacillus nakayamae]SFG56511.1 Glycosyltransferase involved in cell wall bisynthesis [Sporolactobacillus nakayamae]
MKIAIICTEKRPVPAVQGGAVETLVDMLIKDNEQNPQVEFDVYSVENPSAKRQSEQFQHTRFFYIRTKDPFKHLRDIANRLFSKCHVSFYSHAFLTRTIRKLKHQKYDWIIIENRPRFIKSLRRHLGSETRIALHLHNDTLNKECYGARSIIHMCDRVLSVSSYINKRVQAAASEHDKWKARVLYNRIDTALFRPSYDDRSSSRIRKQCGITENRQVVLYYGRLNVGKGVLELIKAFAHARLVTPALYLVLLGNYPHKKDQKKIQPALDLLPMDSYLLMDYINHNELPAYLSIADMIALPSLCNEAFGLTIAESMLLGKTVITTNAGAIPELIGTGTGVVVQTGSNIDMRLTDALLRCAAHPELRNQLGANARKAALHRFRADGYLKELLKRLN